MAYYSDIIKHGSHVNATPSKAFDQNKASITGRSLPAVRMNQGQIATEITVGTDKKMIPIDVRTTTVAEDTVTKEMSVLQQERKIKLRQAAEASITQLVSSHTSWIQQVYTVQEYAETGHSQASIQEIKSALDNMQSVFTREKNHTIKHHMSVVLKAIPFQPWLHNLNDVEAFIPEMLEDLNKIIIKKQPVTESNDMLQTEARVKQGLTQLKKVQSGQKTVSETRTVIMSGIRALSDPKASRNIVSTYLPQYKEVITTWAKSADVDIGSKAQPSVQIKPWQEIDVIVTKMAESSLQADNTLPQLTAPEDMPKWLKKNVIGIYSNYCKALFLCKHEALHAFLSAAPVAMEGALDDFMKEVTRFNQELKTFNSTRYETEPDSIPAHTAGIISYEDIRQIKPEESEQIRFDLQRLYARVNPPKQIDESVLLQFQDYIPVLKNYYFSRLWYGDETAMATAVNSTLIMLTGTDTGTKTHPERQSFIKKLIPSFASKKGSTVKTPDISENTISVKNFNDAVTSMDATLSEKGMTLTTRSQQTTIGIPRITQQVTGTLQTKKLVTEALTTDDDTFDKKWNTTKRANVKQQRTHAVSTPLGSIKPKPSQSTTTDAQRNTQAERYRALHSVGEVTVKSRSAQDKTKKS